MATTNNAEPRATTTEVAGTTPAEATRYEHAHAGICHAGVTIADLVEKPAAPVESAREPHEVADGNHD